jgi:hypothetical protein
MLAKNGRASQIEIVWRTPDRTTNTRNPNQTRHVLLPSLTHPRCVPDGPKRPRSSGPLITNTCCVGAAALPLALYRCPMPAALVPSLLGCFGVRVLLKYRILNCVVYMACAFGPTKTSPLLVADPCPTSSPTTAFASVCTSFHRSMHSAVEAPCACCHGT